MLHTPERGARRLISSLVLTAAITWWLAAGVAYAATPPSNSALPTISGVAQQGDELTADPGTWSGGSPISFSYQWSDGQTGSTDILSPADVGQPVSVTVTASNAAGQMSATSDIVGPVLPAVPVVTAAPVITGTAQQGDTLSVSNGTWSNSPSGYSYVWDDCNSSGTVCSQVAGAASSSYTLQASDVGSTIVAVVTASSSGGQASATSDIVGPVLPAAPVDTTAPGIGGTAQQGHTLTATNGAWSNNPTGYSYVWNDCASSGSGCSPIAGATSSSYKVASADVGKYVSVTVTASNAGGHGSLTSAAVGPVLPPAPVNTTAPSVSGTAAQGDTLTVSKGTWSNSPSAYLYAWEDCGSAGNDCSRIAGATSSSYTLSAADVGNRIMCVVTASGPGGSTSATSNATAAVVAALRLRLLSRPPRLCWHRRRRPSPTRV